MFQITEFIEATLASVTNRVEKHGDDDLPAVSLAVCIDCANTMLDQIDPAIRQALYKPVDGQDQLPGVEPSTPVLRCNTFDTIALTTAHEGWTLELDDSIDDGHPMTFGGCKVDKFKVDAKQGGSIELRFRVGTSDVDADRLGALAMHNGRAIWIKLLPPKQKPAAIDGTTDAFERDHPGAVADDGQADLLDDDSHAPGDAFSDAHGGRGGPEDEGDDDGEGDAPDAEQAEIEAGMRDALAAAGVREKPARRGRKTAANVE